MRHPRPAASPGSDDIGDCVGAGLREGSSQCAVRDRDPREEMTSERWVPFRRATLRQDAVAGLVLGVQSVPDGLATGLLAGVNPLSGLYAYMVGTITGAVVTSSAFMAIQGTGAMAMIVVDVPAVHDAEDPARALFTLSMLTGVVMLVAGLLPTRIGAALRVQRGDGRVHQRCRRQHHPGPAGELHGLCRRRAQPGRPRRQHAHPSRTAPVGNGGGRRRHDRVDHPPRADAHRSDGPGRRRHRHVGGPGDLRLGRAWPR